MKVILKDTKEVKDVKFGYAVHYLLPKGLAEPATPEKIAELEEKQARRQSQKATQAQRDQVVAQKLNGQKVTLKAKVKKEDKLYGSVTVQQIEKAIKKLVKLPIDTDLKVDRKESIKTLGEHGIGLKIGKSSAKVKVVIEKEA